MACLASKLQRALLQRVSLIFFQLYCSEEVVDDIVRFTNAYAEEHIAEKRTYQNSQGGWTPTTREEMYKFFALLIFQGMHRLPCIRDYWRQTSLYNGNYARLMIPTCERFNALLTFLKVVDHTTEEPDDRLCKVRYLYDHLREKSRTLYKPGQTVSIDERMVKSKARFVFKQYIPQKPVKWGFKIFAACDADSGMLCDFEAYTGQANGGDDGLTHDVVVRLTDRFANQGYVFVTDNFYTSRALADTLTDQGSHLLTIRSKSPAFS